MKIKILFCLTFLFLFISSYGSPIFCKKCRNKGYFYSYEMCPVCLGSGTVTSHLAGKRGGTTTRTVRCSNCGKLGCGYKTGYIRVKKNCNCCNSNCKNKKNKRYINPKLKSFFK